MNSENNNNGTPRLRFPGFTGEWEFMNGDELFMPISNKNHNSDLPILALTQDQGAVPRDLINYNVIVSDKSVAGYKVVEVDDFIISLRSFQGGIEYSRYKGLCSPAYIVLRKKDKDLCSDFYRFYFKSFNYIQDLNKNLEGIRDGKMISYKQFSEIKLPRPIQKEQQKIATCLSAIESLMVAQGQKVEALKERERGLMQQLFPKPGEITPCLRFPGFEGEWVEKKLGDLLIERKESSIITEELPQLAFTIADGVIWPEDRKTNRRDFLMKDKENKKFSVTRLHDIIYNPANIVHGAIHKNNLCDGVVSPIYKIFWTNENADFLNYLLRRPSFISLLALHAEGTVTKLKTLKSEVFLEMSVTFPVNVYEQNLIAGCFNAFDHLIKDESLKLDILRAQKHGLIQQLFPQSTK